MGAETAIAGTGDLDKDVSGGTYDMELKAGGGLIDSHFTGNNCEPKSFDLPLGIGSLAWDGISCPLSAGSGVKIGFHSKLAASLPAAVATSDISIRAVDRTAKMFSVSTSISPSRPASRSDLAQMLWFPMRQA